MDLVIMNSVFYHLTSVVKCSIKLDFDKVLTPSKYTERDALLMPLHNDKILYTTEFEIGSHDKVSVSIDTGLYATCGSWVMMRCLLQGIRVSNWRCTPITWIFSTISIKTILVSIQWDIIPRVQKHLKIRQKIFHWLCRWICCPLRMVMSVFTFDNMA